MALDKAFELQNLFFILELAKQNHFPIAAGGKIALQVKHVGSATGHASSEIPARLAENYHPTTGHVLATMVSDSLYHRVDTGIAHAEPLPGDPANIGLAAGSAVEGNIAYDNVLVRCERGPSWGLDDQFRSRKTFAEIIICVAFQLESDAPAA